ncbi:hypothetical protein F5X99DRAFT_405056 [Biscogniauxia marginata]|nr:hypothetical protein F5X99DRAFT_405056 [Biscogniauxia marginata]
MDRFFEYIPRRTAFSTSSEEIPRGSQRFHGRAQSQHGTQPGNAMNATDMYMSLHSSMLVLEDRIHMISIEAGNQLRHQDRIIAQQDNTIRDQRNELGRLRLQMRDFESLRSETRSVELEYLDRIYHRNRQIEKRIAMLIVVIVLYMVFHVLGAIASWDSGLKTERQSSGSSVSGGSPQLRLRVPQPVNLTGHTGSSGNGRPATPGSPDPANRLPSSGSSGSLRHDVLMANLRNSASGRREIPEGDNPQISAEEMAEVLDNLVNESIRKEIAAFIQGRSNAEHMARFETIIERVEAGNKDVKDIMDRMESYYGMLLEELHCKLNSKDRVLASTMENSEREMKWLYRVLLLLVSLVLILLTAIAIKL